MIFFRQFKRTNPFGKGKGIATDQSGLIETASTVDALEEKYTSSGNSIMQGNVVDLESGKTLSRQSYYDIPAWVLDPTVRAIRVAQWKQQQKTKQRKGKVKHENK
jgi:hypothetical protein